MRKRLAALLLALVLAVGCAAAPESGSVSPPVSPSPAPAESPAPPPAGPEPAPEEPEEGAEALPKAPPLKTPEDYTQEQLDFFEKYFPDMDSFWSDAYLQKNGEEIFAIVNPWLSLSPEQLEKESLGVVARSRDGTKTVYTLHDDRLEEYYWPYCDIWNDRTTGESRFLYATYYDRSVQNETADTLLLYNRTTLRAFSLDTGEELERFVPDFDFGEEVSYYERERMIYGIANDKEAGTVVVAYINWAERDDEARFFPLRLAVYDREGTLVRDFALWAKVHNNSKSFYTYADKMTFPQPGTLCLFYDSRVHRPYPLRLNYLTDPVPLDEGEILDLWDTLEGVWADPGQPEYGEKGLEAAFFLREGRPVLRVDGAECPVSAVRRWSEITWEITARGGEGERTFYVDTHHPKDFAILVMEKGDLEYSNCIYTGEAG